MPKHYETPIPITPRKGPEITFDDSIPRFWLGGDPFKTRFFDAMSTMFPEGEKFFIQCVRDYSDRIADPGLKEAVKGFNYQEGQHSLVHRRFNDHLKTQGVDVDWLERLLRDAFKGLRGHLPKTMTLAQTAATEHLTAVMSHQFMARRALLADADPRLRAMYYWHAAEEIEHKGIAFDVLKEIAGGGYFVRVLTMLWVTMAFTLHTFLIIGHMFRADGFSWHQRAGLWLRGLWWLYRPGGLILPLLPHYLAYYRPGFHPWQSGDLEIYRRWREAFDETGDTIRAGEVVYAA
jgi:predicted metal-dependent hydrolase